MWLKADVSINNICNTFIKFTWLLVFSKVYDSGEALLLHHTMSRRKEKKFIFKTGINVSIHEE